MTALPRAGDPQAGRARGVPPVSARPPHMVGPSPAPGSEAAQVGHAHVSLPACPGSGVGYDIGRLSPESPTPLTLFTA